MKYNEEALDVAYEKFKENGYSKSKEEYVKLISTNKEAFGTAYDIFKANGYTKSSRDFYDLMGIGRKVSSSKPNEDFPVDEEVEEDRSGFAKYQNKNASIMANLEDTPKLTSSKFLSKNNEVIVEEELSKDEIEEEHVARQNTSQEDWEKSLPPKEIPRAFHTGDFVDGVQENIGELTGAFNTGLNLGAEIFNDIISMTPFGDGKPNSSILTGESDYLNLQEKNEKEKKERKYNSWKNQYSTDVSFIDENQQTIENFIEQKINDGSLIVDGESIKGFSRVDGKYKAIPEQIEQYKNNSEITKQYNAKRTNSIINKDIKGIKKLWGVEATDDMFSLDFNLESLSEDQKNDPKLIAFLEAKSKLTLKVKDLKKDKESELVSTEEAGISGDAIDVIFSDGGGSSLDQEEFKEWFANHKYFKAQTALRYNVTVSNDGEQTYTTNTKYSNSDNSEFKASVIETYIAEKSQKLAEQNKAFKNYGVDNLLKEINQFALEHDALSDEYVPMYEELAVISKEFENGSREKTKKNVDNYNKKLNAANLLKEKHQTSYDLMTSTITPKDIEVINGYLNMSNSGQELQRMRSRFLENTDFGSRYSDKLKLQKSRNELFEGYTGGALEVVPVLYNTLVNTFNGVMQTMNAGQIQFRTNLGEEGLQDRGLMMNDHMNSLASNFTIVTNDTPFTDPVTGELNMTRLLPTLTKTVGDMFMMIRGGKISYSLSKTAAKMSKNGLLKIGTSPSLLAKITPSIKNATSMISTGAGSLPILLPAKMEEALAQVDENFSAEDAFEYAVKSALEEAMIEVLNPDWKWTRADLSTVKNSLKKGENVLSAFKKYRLNSLKQSLKTVAPEVLEEYLQNAFSGATNLAYNKQFNTDFEVPNGDEMKETALLTSLSVLVMRGFSGNLTKSNRTSMLRTAQENNEAFFKELNKQFKEGNISKEEAIKWKEEVEGFALANAEINDMIYDEDGSVKMTQGQADRLIELVMTRSNIQSKIDENAIGDLDVDLQIELDNINKAINNERNIVASEHDSHKIYENSIIKKEILKKLKDSDLTEKGKTELNKELAKIEKENKILEANSPEYEVAGKSYKTKKEFLKAINTAKMNGSLKRRKQLNIKVKNDLQAEREAYKQLGSYAPAEVKGRVVMTNKQALENQDFIGNKTDIDLRVELKQELLKPKNQQNKIKIQEYKNALKYLALKKANYEFGKTGFLVKPVVISKNELADLQLENNIDAVDAATKQFGGELEILTNEQALEKYGNKVYGANGFFIPKYDKDGKQTGFKQVINKDIAKNFKARSVASHEMLHQVLFSVLNGPMRSVIDKQGEKVYVKITPKGVNLIKGFLEILGPDIEAILNEKLDEGGYRFRKYDDSGVGVPGTENTFEEYAEEYLNMYHDAVVGDKSITVETKKEKTRTQKVVDYFRNFFNDVAPELTNINIIDSQDLFEFLGSYNTQAIQNKFNENVVSLGKQSIQDQKDVFLADAKNTDFQKLLKDDQESDVKMSISQRPLDLQEKGDLFSKTNQELSIALQAYGLEGEFDSKNEEHLDIWNGIPKQEKLFIGYSIGNLWRKYAKNKLLVQYGNTPNFKDYESDILDVLTTGVEVGQNGLPYIVSTWDPTQRKLTSHIWDLLGTRIPHVTRLPQFAGFGKSLDSQYDDEINNKIDDKPSKTNILKFEKVKDKIDAIKKIVKVKKEDTFKEISDKFTGRVAQVVFGVPQAKITDPKKNLTYAKKFVNGIPEPSEAGNIQDFYRVGSNAEKLIKILPRQSVSSQDADINEIGENVEVSRSVYGRGLGLSNRMLNYFYNKTGKRSSGLTSQTPVWELKPEFINPSQETINKLKENLGITPKGELNNYDRNIGQLLKGLAKFQGQQTALSTAQRILEPTIAEVKQEQAQEVKQQLANIRAGQSNLAFSRSIKRVDRMIAMTYEFDLGITGKDKLLSFHEIAKTFDLKSQEGIDEFIKELKTTLLPLMPRDFWFGKPDTNGNYGTAFTPSSKVAPGPLYKAYFEPEMKKLRDLPDSNFGPKVDVDNFTVSSYETMFKDDKTIKANRKKGKDGKSKIDKWNEKVAKIHETMWVRFNDAIVADKNSARVIATYLGMVGSSAKHWHKLGAQFAGHSTTLEGVRYEYEHAMPATAAYLYLLDSALNDVVNFGVTYQLVMDNYKLIALDKAMDNKLRDARTESGYSLQRRMPDNWSVLTNNWYERYFNDIVNGIENGIDPNSLQGLDGRTFAEIYNIKPVITKPGIKNNKRVSDAIMRSRTVNPNKGISVLDFDDTLATSKSNVLYTTPDGAKGKLTAEEFAKQGADLLEQGYVYDFSEFSKVVGGEVASLFNKALKLQGKFGPENMFVLTARPANSASAIFEFLKANGLNIPLKNITGLGNSTPESKALWMADKVAEGYNDFYFADDALQNVQAVDDMLEQFDVKRKVQQAKINFSKNTSVTFNDIIEQTTGIESEKVFSQAQAKIRGSRSKYKSIIPPSAQDFAGLLYNFLGKGKKGEQDMAFFKKALIDPFARGINELNASKQAAANDYENLLEQFPDVKKIINKKIENTDYTNDQAMRIYLWNKAGFEIPGLSIRDLNAVISMVQNKPKIQAFADAVGLISKKENGYSKPGDFWLAENIKSDLLSDGSIGDARSEFLSEWQQNADLIFSPDNLNKIEAIYGSNFREALEDVLYRMKSGRNRPAGGGRLMNIYTNWVNNSVGAIMFLNMRSALLQTISATNYINWSDNNPLKAAAAFANQKQYWSDFTYLFNSDYLKQRRSGNQRGINEAELSAAVAGAENKAKAAIAWLLKKGFLPTQIADSFAISSGGATFYRNRVKKYVKDGMLLEEAESKAFLDFQETTEVAQQSARPDMISQQQASPLGKLILAFQNTPMQYARIMNKAARDLANGRGDSKTHMSKIIYYGFVQSIIFGALQSALFASLDDEDEEKFDKKKERILNGMVDSVLSGIGYGGKAVSTMKNTLITFLDQRKRGFNADHTYTILQLLGFSPPIGSKLRKIYSSIQTDKFNKDVFLRRGFTLDNPIWSAIGNVVEGVTNLPLGRLSQKMLNIDNALDANNNWWQRAALVLGWNTWDLGIRDADIEGIKAEIKVEKKAKSKENAKIKKEIKKKEKEKENESVIEENKKKSKKDGICSAVSKSGRRCKNKAINGGMCTIHEKAEKNESGKKTQCRKRKDNGKRCGMQTSNKSGYCYYHD